MATFTRLLIDGSTLEGGGQILRNSVSLAALLGRPIKIEKIRAGRPKSGLKNQHAAGIQLVGEIANAELVGAEAGSHTLDFTPGANSIYPCSRPYIADSKTAGSITLLLQVSLPCLLFSPLASSDKSEVAHLTLRGGTNASNAPAVDYTQHVFLPFLRKQLGLNISLEIRQRGYFPKGGGEIVVRIPPVRGPLRAFDLSGPPGRVTRIYGRAYVAGVLPILIAKKSRRAAEDALRASPLLKEAWPTIEIEEVKEENGAAVGSGSGLFIWAETENGCVYGGTAIGGKNREPEKVGKEAVYELLKAIDGGGCVDEYLQDQIIIFMALAEGTSAVRTGELTLHTRTAMWVAEQLTGVKFEVEQHMPGINVIRVEGIGYTARTET